ncbi:uncharacterized protein N7511_009997 [Penicillium nucicola]|uniref:uncharacterized protein n=1 Tax=Penicillium nucicola TaxID=1850975 RepID=UPI0025456A56|nr:uncharacterized protein N7511_009997 [Penicillium nucicola]KAJ5748301.1 hypothetical protein N7511_009997 [Penicillium nucicola]
MTDPQLVTVMDGDMLKQGLGLKAEELALLRTQTNIIVHSASSIALLQPIERLVGPIISATENLAQLAMGFDRLECFVFVSTAYCNAHLFAQSDGTSTLKVQESLYPLNCAGMGNDAEIDLKKEWQDVKSMGSSSACRNNDFPWPYGYAKHLTERLLDYTFASSNIRLLIIRPSIIEPAQCFPYRQFCIPMSTPHIIFTAALALTLSRNICFSSRFDDPYHDSSIDYVPVDVVVDRILAHVAYGTHGPVHTVAGPARISFRDTWERTLPLRRMPWDLHLTWTRQSWHSKSIHPLGRIYRTVGTSFEFTEAKTISLWQNLSDLDRSGLHLFADLDILYYDHGHVRSDHLWESMMHLTKNRRWARRLVKLLYRSLDKSSSSKIETPGCACLTINETLATQ